MSAPGDHGSGGHGSGGLAARLGIFARSFRRDTPGAVAEAVARAGYALGTGTSPAIGRAGVGIPSVSATYNLIHPDAGLRAAQTAQAVRLIGLAPDLGAEVVTLCSGTRDPDDIWRAHPRNLATDASTRRTSSRRRRSPASARSWPKRSTSSAPG